MLGPIWIEEGGAEFAAIYLSDEKGWIDYKKSMIEYLDEARSVIADAASRGDIVSLKDYEIGKVIGKLESSSNPSEQQEKKHINTLLDLLLIFLQLKENIQLQMLF